MPKVYFKTSLLTLLLAAIGLLSLNCVESQGLSEEEIHRPRQRPPEEPAGPKRAELKGIFVDQNASGSTADGKSWDTAFKTIGQAIRAARGEDIIVAQGLYRENLDLTDKSNLVIRGGYIAGNKLQKFPSEIKASDFATIESQAGVAEPIIKIAGNARNIYFIGGLNIQASPGQRALEIIGTPAQKIKTVKLWRINFNNNRGAANGGAILIEHAKNISLYDVNAFGNRATADGGFMHISHSDGIKITGGQWHDNQAGGIGGALFANEVQNFSFAPKELKENKAQGGNGGGLFLSNTSNPKITGTQYEGNEAHDDGGAVALSNCSNPKLTGSQFKSNISGGDGGALSISNADQKIMLFGLNFEKNHAQGMQGGGAIVFDVAAVGARTFSELNMNAVRFYKNEAVHAAGDGGAIRFSDGVLGQVKIHNSHFVENKARNGAAISLENAAVALSIAKGSSFSENEASVNGGALYVWGQTQPIKIFNTTFNGNQSERGGAVYIDELRAELSFRASKFFGNQASVNGGALFLYRIHNIVAIENSQFIGNVAQHFGGAMALDPYYTSARFTIDQHSIIRENRCAVKACGGGLFVSSRNILTGTGSINSLTIKARYDNVKNNVSTEGTNLGNFLSLARSYDINSNDPWPTTPVGLVFRALIGGGLPATIRRHKYFMDISATDYDLGDDTGDDTAVYMD